MHFLTILLTWSLAYAALASKPGAPSIAPEPVTARPPRAPKPVAASPPEEEEPAERLPRPSGELPVKAMPCEGKASYPVHLTFDDGPEVPGTDIILDELKRRHIKATFFISTNHFEGLLNGHPSKDEKKAMAMIERMKREGHTIGDHSYKHIYHADLSKFSEDTVERNLEHNDAAWAKLNLKTPAPFRFPYGSGWFQDENNQAQANKVMAEIKQKGYWPMHWDLDTWDWSDIKCKALPESLLRQICNHQGGVIIMHDVQHFTQRNIGSIIDSILASKHRIVSNAEIVKYSQTKPLVSLEDKAAGIFSCHGHLSELDQIWPSCKDYRNQVRKESESAQ